MCIMQLYPQQQKAIEAIEAFLDSADSVFILKGYAGTGKTTIIRTLCDILNRDAREPMLMAPTGRAAKVLSEKTGKEATTIHKRIYHNGGVKLNVHDKDGKPIDEPNKDNADIDDIDFYFSVGLLTDNREVKRYVIIVDEASLISSRPTKQEMLHFGTDALLPDLLTFAQLSLGTKIVFVGDPAQLPPVGDNCSQALSEDYFKSLEIGVRSFMLDEVVRQKSDNVILSNAMKVRRLIDSPIRNCLTFDLKPSEMEELSASEIVERFVKESPVPRLDRSVIICYTNAQALEYNSAIRSHYFEGDAPCNGDIMQVVHNNIGSPTSPGLLNGDFIRLVDTPGAPEVHQVPVWVNREGKRERVHIELKFSEVIFETDHGENGRAKLLYSFLLSGKPALSHSEAVALYLDFVIRHPNLKTGTEVFKQALYSDPYYNAIQAKYGYAITCHKSQGGEWETVYVDYSRRTGLDNDSLRWNYTATTRASRCLCGVNLPHLTPLAKLDISAAIRSISRPQAEVVCYADTECSLLPTASAARKAKCNSAASALLEIGAELLSVSERPYRDRYTVRLSSGDIRQYDLQYNGAGIFTSISALHPAEEDEEILSCLHDTREHKYVIEYTPSSDCLRNLFNIVRSIADEIGVSITGIKEYPAQYYVLYGLKTDAPFASLQFYFNGKGFVTRAIVSSFLGTEDVQLVQFIRRLKELTGI